MQGNLREIELNSLISLIEFGQRSGELLIESTSGGNWLIFFVQGAIAYATESPSPRNRLRDYLSDLAPQVTDLPAIPPGLDNLPEYGQIWTLLEKNAISGAIASQIIQSIILEVLFDLLPLTNGIFSFELTAPLSPQLVNFRFSQYRLDLAKKLQRWRQFYPQIHSPQQTPQWHRLPPSPGYFKPEQIDGKTSIRQLCRRTGKDLITICEQLNQAWDQGEIILAALDLTHQNKTKRNIRIVCIDDSITTCRTVEYMLHHLGYQVTGITNPTRALSLVFQLKPSLIFCDIEMPELNGYELCTMLRKSATFAYTPIVMLTGRDEFIDRVKARRAGATEYLSKPFAEQELLAIAERYNKPNI
jgi:twitching motility two-component system response regulator PilG